MRQVVPSRCMGKDRALPQCLHCIKSEYDANDVPGLIQEGLVPLAGGITNLSHVRIPGPQVPNNNQNFCARLRATFSRFLSQTKPNARDIPGPFHHQKDDNGRHGSLGLIDSRILIEADVVFSKW
jgi:hypothetical protein